MRYTNCEIFCFFDALLQAIVQFWPTQKQKEEYAMSADFDNVCLITLKEFDSKNYHLTHEFSLKFRHISQFWHSARNINLMVFRNRVGVHKNFNNLAASQRSNSILWQHAKNTCPLFCSSTCSLFAGGRRTCTQRSATWLNHVYARSEGDEDPPNVQRKNRSISLALFLAKRRSNANRMILPGRHEKLRQIWSDVTRVYLVVTVMPKEEESVLIQVQLFTRFSQWDRFSG